MQAAADGSVQYCVLATMSGRVGKRADGLEKGPREERAGIFVPVAFAGS